MTAPSPPSSHAPSLPPPPLDLTASSRDDIHKLLTQHAEANGYKPLEHSTSQKTDCPFSVKTQEVLAPNVPPELRKLVHDPASGLPPVGTWQIVIKHGGHNHGPIAGPQPEGCQAVIQHVSNNYFRPRTTHFPGFQSDNPPQMVPSHPKKKKQKSIKKASPPPDSYLFPIFTASGSPPPPPPAPAPFSPPHLLSPLPTKTSDQHSPVSAASDPAQNQCTNIHDTKGLVDYDSEDPWPSSGLDEVKPETPQSGASLSYNEMPSPSSILPPLNSALSATSKDTTQIAAAASAPPALTSLETQCTNICVLNPPPFVGPLGTRSFPQPRHRALDVRHDGQRFQAPSTKCDTCVPHWLQQYVQQISDPKPNGHCGYRAIAISVGRSEHKWLLVHEDLIHQLQSKSEYYNTHIKLRMRGDGDVAQHIQAIKTQREEVLNTPELWLDLAQMMYVIANTYKQVFCVYSEAHSFSALPLDCAVNNNPPIFLFFDQKPMARVAQLSTTSGEGLGRQVYTGHSKNQPRQLQSLPYPPTPSLPFHLIQQYLPTMPRFNGVVPTFNARKPYWLGTPKTETQKRHFARMAAAVQARTPNVPVIALNQGPALDHGTHPDQIIGLPELEAMFPVPQLIEDIRLARIEEERKQRSLALERATQEMFYAYIECHLHTSECGDPSMWDVDHRPMCNFHPHAKRVRKVDLVDILYRRKAEVTFCRCEENDNTRLIYMGYIGGSPKYPETAFSIRLLQLFHIIWKYCTSRVDPFTRALDEYLDAFNPLILTKNKENALDIELTLSSQEKLGENCPRCFGPSVPSQTDSEPDVVVCLDGNFQHRRHIAAGQNAARDPTKLPSSFLPEDKVNRMEQRLAGLPKDTRLEACAVQHTAPNDVWGKGHWARCDGNGMPP
ncbi:uncharacterized protein MELLADRAFT_95670 [Melampsora larici-populina 98AG31]|uniref:CxC1-like cysteine cluster associated with KDZ transposases domain-containing protein n=1 Tax=Melampsora larici-populina (strain 98AG31 / pathotype 3-4-7) TaxID=747676 RepID=F4SA67_MELLP|nr:uncharacterized protein MELLADRAFT_95670 [Melampsora larici-populina 98AG31]EGF98459.1 hypothetical protein MELLADRAFT_95670 [Melampsora larici-populina 98AG31]